MDVHVTPCSSKGMGFHEGIQNVLHLRLETNRSRSYMSMDSQCPSQLIRLGIVFSWNLSMHTHCKNMPFPPYSPLITVIGIAARYRKCHLQENCIQHWWIWLFDLLMRDWFTVTTMNLTFWSVENLVNPSLLIFRKWSAPRMRMLNGGFFIIPIASVLPFTHVTGILIETWNAYEPSSNVASNMKALCILDLEK